MIKAILFDLSGVYFSEGTKTGVGKIYSIIDAPKEKIDEIFFPHARKEGFLYRKGKLTEDEFWRLAMDKLNIDKNTALKLKDVLLSSFVPNPGMKELVQC